MCNTKIGVSPKETMGSRSYKLLIALIMLSSIAFIFVVIGISIGGTCTYSELGIQPASTGIPLVQGNSGSELVIPNSLENNDVSVPLECEMIGLDTETGFIKVYDYYIDDPLPLCLCDETISDWYIDFCVWGGYTPTDGCVTVWQPDPDKIGMINKGCLDIEVAEIGTVADCCCDVPCCCEAELWRATFNDACGCGVILDSNHLPTFIDETCIGNEFNCWEMPAQTDPGRELGKLVNLEISMDWEGCNGPDQSCEVILAHKNYIPGVPHSNSITHRQ